MRTIAPLELDRAAPTLQEAVAHHPELGNRELNQRDKIILSRLDAEYARYRDDMLVTHNIDLTALPKPKFLQESGREWLKRPSVERYIELETMRAKHLASVHLPELVALPKGKCLDIGTRSCLFLREMHGQDPQHDWQGVDIPLATPLPTCATQLARDKCPGFKSYAPGDSLPYANGEFKAATLNCTLHHVDPKFLDDGFLDDVHRVIAPNGKLLIVEDYMGMNQVEKNPSMVVKATDDLFYPTSPGTQKPANVWVKQLERHGFHVEKTERVPGYNVAGIPVVELNIVATRK